MRTPGSTPLRCTRRARAAGSWGRRESNTDIVRLITRRQSAVARASWSSCCSSPPSRWGIILYKVWQFRRAARQSATFLDVFRKSSKFSEVQAVCRTLAESPLVGLFQSGYAELNSQLRQAAPADAAQAGGAPPDVQP